MTSHDATLSEDVLLCLVCGARPPFTKEKCKGLCPFAAQQCALSETAPTAEGFWNDKLPGGISAPSARGTSVAMVDALNQWRDKWVEELPERALVDFDRIVP